MKAEGGGEKTGRGATAMVCVKEDAVGSPVRRDVLRDRTDGPGDSLEHWGDSLGALQGVGLVNAVDRGNSHQKEKDRGKSALWERRSAHQVQCGTRGPVEVSGGRVQQTGLSASPEPWGKLQTRHQHVEGGPEIQGREAAWVGGHVGRGESPVGAAPPRGAGRAGGAHGNTEEEPQERKPPARTRLQMPLRGRWPLGLRRWPPRS